MQNPFRVFMSLPRVRKKLSKSRCPVDLERDEVFHMGRKTNQCLVPQNHKADSNLVVCLHGRDHERSPWRQVEEISFLLLQAVIAAPQETAIPHLHRVMLSEDRR